MGNSEIMVSIRCAVYNHEKYIRDCLDGFVMQKTNFRFEAIVHDDASTDNTASIIKEYAEKYPDIIKPIYETENQYSKHDGSIRRIMDVEMRGKYIAMCEGDDYWTDPLKLQKQVDFMENNLEVGLCCSKSVVFVDEDNEYKEEKGTLDCEKYSTILLGYNDLNTATTLFRKDLWLCCQSELNNKLPQDLFFDTAYWYWFARNSKIKYFDEVYSVYRVLPESACHTKDLNKSIELQKRFIRLKIMFLSAYPLENEDERNVVYKDIMNSINELSSYSKYVGEELVRCSKAYRIGKKITGIGRWLKRKN